MRSRYAIAVLAIALLGTPTASGKDLGPGDLKVCADLITSEGTLVYEFGPKFRVKAEPDFFAEVKALLGEAAVA